MSDKPEYIYPLKYPDLHSEIMKYIEEYNTKLFCEARDFFIMIGDKNE